MFLFFLTAAIKSYIEKLVGSLLRMKTKRKNDREQK